MKFSNYILCCLSVFSISLSLYAQSYSGSSSSFNNGENTNSWYGPWGNFSTVSRSARIYLNDSADASDQTNIRKLIDIKIPENNQYWYFVFSTSPPENNDYPMRVSDKISNSLLQAKKNKTESDLSGVEIPFGTDSVTIYLLNTENAALFAVGNNNFDFIYEGTVKDRRQGLIQVQSHNESGLKLGILKTGKHGDCNVDFNFLFVLDSNLSTTTTSDPFQNNFFNNNFFNDDFFSKQRAESIGNQGWRAFQQGDYNKCLQLSKEALALDNTLGFVHFNIALVYLIKGQNVKAKKKYQQAIAINCRDVWTKRTLDGAVDDLKTYMHLFPSKKTAYKLLNQLTALANKY